LNRELKSGSLRSLISRSLKLPRELRGKIKARTSAHWIPIMILVTGMLLGQVSNFVLIKTGFLEEVDAVTAFCVVGIVLSVTLWIWVRPNPLKAGWALWWRALIMGPVIVVCGIALDTAFRLLPVATVTALTLVMGAHLSAGFRIAVTGRQGLRDLRWLAGSLCGVLLLFSHGNATLKGLLLILIWSVAYHLSQIFRSTLPKEDLDTYSALVRPPLVLIMIYLLFFTGEGITGVLGMGWFNFLLCVWVGVSGTIVALISNFAWKKGAGPVSESMLAPLNPALTAVVGTMAGQALPWTACVGIALIALSSIGGARSTLRRQMAAERQ
jgi:hypothetical protein